MGGLSAIMTEGNYYSVDSLCYEVGTIIKSGEAARSVSTKRVSPL